MGQVSESGFQPFATTGRFCLINLLLLLDRGLSMCTTFLVIVDAVVAVVIADTRLGWTLMKRHLDFAKTRGCADLRLVLSGLGNDLTYGRGSTTLAPRTRVEFHYP
ncbi:unnamed protein product [Boreogadus saida]